MGINPDPDAGLDAIGLPCGGIAQGYVADSSPYVPGLSYSQFSMLMVVELCLCFLAWFWLSQGTIPGRGYFR